MANAIYPKAKEAFLSGSINLTSDTIKVALVKTASGYTYSASDQFWSAVAANVIGTPVTLSGKSVTSGVFSATNPVITDAPTSSAVGAVVFYKDTGTNSTSPLLVFDDTGTGLPLTANGASITIDINTPTNKIFTL